MKVVSLSRLASYKMNYGDILTYIKQKGIDVNKPYNVIVIDDGAMVEYTQEETRKE